MTTFPPRTRARSPLAERAFTLLELIVVVIIIGVLALIAALGYNSYISNARDRSLAETVSALNLAITARSTADDAYPSAVVGSAKAAGGLASYLSINPGGYTFTPDSSASPAFVKVKSTSGTRSACLLLGTDIGQAGTTGTGCVGIPTLTGSLASSTSGALTWTAVDDATSYTVTRTATTYNKATFAGPISPAVDTDGNLLVVDFDAARIRKRASSGDITTLAGSTPGYQDGAALDAMFHDPGSIAVAPSGNIYVADRANFRIRKITPGGTVSTYAGTGTSGFLDGPKDTAQIGTVWGIAVDSSENVYFADTSNNRIRKITAATGIVSTVAGSGVGGYKEGTGTGAQFNSPWSVAVDSSTGNLYVGDNNRVRLITPTGVTSRLAGTGAASPTRVDGAGTVATFYSPRGITLGGDNNLYVTDYNAGFYDVRKVTLAGVVSTVAGAGTNSSAGTDAPIDGPALSATFFRPIGVARASDGTLYVADQGNHLVRMVKSGVVSTITGNASTKDGSDTVTTVTGPTTVYSGPLLTFTDPGLQVGSEYTYSVTATSADGTGLKSNPVTLRP